MSRLHHWTIVLRRRWCLGCDAFQTKIADASAGVRERWVPEISESCPRSTPWAKNQDEADRE